MGEKDLMCDDIVNICCYLSHDYLNLSYDSPFDNNIQTQVNSTDYVCNISTMNNR